MKKASQLDAAAASGVAPSTFVPLGLPPTAPTPADIRIELHRGITAINVSWPSTAASECAAWMRELLLHLWEALHVWLQLERTRVPDGSGIAKAIDYSLNHWGGLERFLLDGDVPIDNKYVENRIRPWVAGTGSSLGASWRGSAPRW